jgi:hypothetical protein
MCFPGTLNSQSLLTRISRGNESVNSSNTFDLRATCAVNALSVVRDISTEVPQPKRCDAQFIEAIEH